MNGEWWIGDRADMPSVGYKPPEHTVSGTLNDSGADKWSLDTIGNVSGQSLLDRLDGKNQLPAGPATIWGVNADMRAFSLLNCYTVQTIVHFGSLREGTERLQVGTIVEGDGIWVDSETLVDEIIIQYQDLAAWAWDRQERGAEPEFTDDGIILTISLIPNVEDARVHEYPIQLSWGREAPLTDGPINVKLSASFTITDALRIADIAEKWVFPLGQLLSLLTLSHCGISSVRGRIFNERVDGHAQYVNLRFQQTSARTGVDGGEQGPLGRQLDMLATRTALEEKGIHLTALLSAFLKLEENPKLRDALSHFLDSQARAEVHEVDEALRCLFNAFENLHAACFEGTVEDGEELGAVLKELVARAPVEHRNEVSLRLGRKKPKPIKRKLQDLVDNGGEVAARVLALRPELVADAGDARNEIAHANPRSASQWKRHLVLMDVQWLMRHAFLQLLGVQPSGCDDIFRQVGRPFSQYVGHQ